MYAVFQVGKQQYQATEGELIRVDQVPAEVGQKVIFDQVLLVRDKDQAPRWGQPFIKDARIETEVVKQYRGEKILVFNFKRRKGYHKQKGHRQNYTSVKVLRIEA